MKKLTDASVAQMLSDYDLGMTPAELSKSLKVSIPAITYWLPYLGLDAKWLRHVRSMETHCRRLLTKAENDRKCLSAATSVIRQFQPSPRRRSIVATAIRAQFHLSRTAANKIVGIAANAGEAERVNRADDVLISIMRRYLAENPGQGFSAMFSVLLRDKPGTRYRALQLYTQHKFGINHRPRSRKAPQATRKVMSVPTELNAMWSMDFMEDGLESGQRFWILNVIDDCNREALVMQAMKRRSAKAVTDALDKIIQAGRQPNCIRTDRGGEFKSVRYQTWTGRATISRAYSRPRVPTDNVLVETFNRAVRLEVLNHFRFRSLAEVQRALDDWQLRYNFARPNKPLGNLSPMQYTHLLNKRT